MSIVGATPCIRSYSNDGKPVAGLRFAVSETFATPWTARTTGGSGSSLTFASGEGSVILAAGGGIASAGPLARPPQPESQAYATSRAMQRRVTNELRCFKALEDTIERMTQWHH